MKGFLNKLVNLVSVVGVWAGAVWAAPAAEPLAMVFELGRPETVQRLEIKAGEKAATFFLAGEGELGEIEGSVLQEGGGLMVPVADSRVECRKLASEKSVTLWKVTIVLPEKEQPVSYAVVFKEAQNGQLLARGLVRLQMKEVPPEPVEKEGGKTAKAKGE